MHSTINHTKTELFIEISCGLLLLLFLYTAISKLIDYANFRATLYSSPLIGHNASWLAWLLPAAELGVAVCLFIPGLRLKGLWAALLLLLLFTFYLLFILIFKSHNLPCSCGGVLRQMTWRQHIVFNTFFILLSCTSIRQFKKNQQIGATGLLST